MRKKDQQLEKALLEIADKMAQEEGLNAINIRSLAQKAGVATGTVYNYFENKDAILLAITEDYWQKALLQLQEETQETNFSQQLESIYLFLRTKFMPSGDILMESLRNVRGTGRGKMIVMQQSLAKIILDQLKRDKEIKSEVWTKDFTMENFTQIILANLLLFLRQNRENIRPFIIMVERIIYSTKES